MNITVSDSKPLSDELNRKKLEITLRNNDVSDVPDVSYKSVDIEIFYITYLPGSGLDSKFTYVTESTPQSGSKKKSKPPHQKK